MDTWDYFQHWSLVLPPSRPSTEQIAAIRKHIKEIDKSLPVAVLGSTPEFRDLLYEVGFKKIFVIDKNRDFNALVTKLMVHQSQETLIVGDWVDQLKEFPNTFSVILSDLTSGNISYERRVEFYQVITNALRPGGIFIDKILTHPMPHIQLDSLYDKYDLMPINLMTVNTFSSELLFCSALLDRTNIVDSTTSYKILDSQVPTDHLRAFVRQARYITPEGGIWHYGLSWSELEPTYCPELVQTEICYEDPASPYYQRVRHFKFTREQ